jgi:hypothetical protein
MDNNSMAANEVVRIRLCASRTRLSGQRKDGGCGDVYREQEREGFADVDGAVPAR